MNVPPPDSPSSANPVVDADAAPDAAKAFAMASSSSPSLQSSPVKPFGLTTPTIALVALGVLIVLGSGAALYRSVQSVQQTQQDAAAATQVLRLRVDQLQQELQNTNARATLAQEQASQLQHLHQALLGLQQQSAASAHVHQAQAMRLQLLAGFAQLKMQTDGSDLLQTLNTQLQALSSNQDTTWKPVSQALQSDVARVQHYQQQGRAAWVAQLDRLMLDVDAWVAQTTAAMPATKPSLAATESSISSASSSPSQVKSAVAQTSSPATSADGLTQLQAWWQAGLQTLSSWIQVQRIDEASVHVLTPTQMQITQAQVQLQLLHLRMDVLAGRDTSVKAGLARLQQVLRVYPAQDAVAAQLRDQVARLASQWSAGLAPEPDLQTSLQALAVVSERAPSAARANSSPAP